jgi:hypothetical protein
MATRFPLFYFFLLPYFFEVKMRSKEANNEPRGLDNINLTAEQIDIE